MERLVGPQRFQIPLSDIMEAVALLHRDKIFLAFN